MATIINATTGSAGGVVITPDTSGIVQVQSNGVNTNAQAWVNFNGTSGASPVIRASYNVSSVVRNTTGDYTITFTNPMPDANYVVTGMGQYNSAGDTFAALIICLTSSISPPLTTTTVRVKTMYASGSASQVDASYACIAIFR